jgi:phosphoribosyl 1,2-cyclic phosphodiesterase
MRFCSLGSGSTGNATLVEAHSGITTTRLLIDCGFSQRELAQRLARRGLCVDQIDAVFVTHEHGDHIGCALALARRHRRPVWMSRGTWRALCVGDESSDEDAASLDGLLHFARDGLPIAVGDLELHPYTVPHDAREPLQLGIGDGAARLGVLTDAGCMTDHIVQHLRGSGALLLECNHDPAMLAASAYPASLKARIGGRLGHLSNAVAAQILAATAHAGLQRVVAAHLSERNNSPALARAALAAAAGGDASDFTVADPLHGTEWVEVG